MEQEKIRLAKTLSKIRRLEHEEMRLVKALQDSGQEDLEDWTNSEV